MNSIQQADDSLTNFLHEADEIKREFESIRETLTHQEWTSLHIDEVLSKAKTIEGRLEEMDRGCELGTAMHRTQTAVVVNGLREKLKELVTDLQELRQRQRRMETEQEPAQGGEEVVMPNEEIIVEAHSAHSAQGGEEEVMPRAIQEHGRGSVLEIAVEIQDRNRNDEAMGLERSLNVGTENRTARARERQGRRHVVFVCDESMCVCVGIMLVGLIITLVLSYIY